MSTIPTTNLELWLDASSIADIVMENGSPISIADKSGKTGVWSINRGALINNAQNNLSSIRFSGSGDVITAPSNVNENTFSFMHNTETHIFGIMKVATIGGSSPIANNSLILTTYNNTDIGPGYRLSYGSSARHGAGIMSHINKGMPGAYVVGVTALNQLINNNWYIFHVVTKPSASIANRGTITIGSRSFANNRFTEPLSTLSSQSKLRLISVDDNNDSITGELGELIIYRGSMSELDVYDIKEVLANKWGLANQLIPLTPTPTPTVTRTPGPTTTPTPTVTPSSTPEILTYVSNSNSLYSIPGITSFSVDRDNLRVFYTTDKGEIGVRSIKNNNLIQYAKVSSRDVFSSAYNTTANKLYVGASASSSSNDNSLLILNADNLTTTTTIGLGNIVSAGTIRRFQATKLILDKTQNKLYGYLFGTATQPIQRLVRWNLSDNSSVNVLTSIYEIYDLYLDEGNSLLYVSAKGLDNINRIYKINTTTDTVVETYNIYARYFYVVNNQIVYTDLDTFYIRDLNTLSINFSYKLHTTVNRLTRNGPYAISYDPDNNTAYVFDAYARSRDPKFFMFNIQTRTFMGTFGFGGANGTLGVNNAYYDSILRKNFAMTNNQYLYMICPENIVKNNSFARSSLPGACVNGVGKVAKYNNYMTHWTVSDTADIVSMSFCRSGEPYNPFASLGPSSGSGFIEQTISTVAGYDYLLEFRIGLAPGFSNTADRMCRVSVLDDNNQTIYNQLFNVKTTPTSTTYNSLGWQTRSAIFTATSSACKLRFSSPDPNISIGGAAIDNIIVTRVTYANTPLPTPTPSPSSPGDNLSAIENWNFNIGSIRLMTSNSTSPMHSQNQPSFYGAVSVDDETIAMIPFSSTNIGLYNSDNYTYINGPAHGKAAGAFFGGVLYANKVVMVPHNSNNIGIYDTTNNLYLDGPQASGFAGGVVTPDGTVVMAPHTASNIGLYNAINNTYIAGPAHNQGSTAVFAGAVYMTNNKILLVPRDANNIGIYDPSNNSYTNGPAHNMVDGAFIGGVLFPSNGKVILIPHNSPNIGIYDIATNSYTNGPAHGRGGAAFAGGVLLPNRKILLVPHTSAYMGIYDPISNTYTNSSSIGTGSAGRFFGGLLIGGDKVVLCPANNANIRYVSFATPANIPHSVTRSPLLNKF